ncbi:OmpH family outer membrane protein [Altererythrobacter aurantiacus]|uniref:OmpH family outer membrane protein n=1 Tax=Parapontixanthobacter aurantiacus TaxID=1463599 RepID=A0A844Z8R0_9SPHN|nr:OmpH family outer membrane protein [Parapontixanthobacter aurantiacus]MXO84971.1 OmpH family outer membrane protein [Parapontixanthobacter aurantiacus]
MKLTKLSFAALSLTASAAAVSLAAPAAAQVNGIAVASPEAVIVRAAARIAAEQQIQTTYATQIQQIRTGQQELTNLQRSLDTNNDGQLTDAEIQANPNVVQQIQTKEQQIAQIAQPIQMAQFYVIEQLVNDYQNARNQVIQQKNITMILAPDAVQYAPESANVTNDITAALDQRLPTVSTTPPAGWQPRRETVQLHQTVQQIVGAVAQQQAAQAAAQGQQQQPATPQPQGR